MRLMGLGLIFVCGSVFASDLEGIFSVSQSNCEVCENMKCSTIDCAITGLAVEYFASSVGAAEKICITKSGPKSPIKQCYQSFDRSQEAGPYFVGKLIIQDGNVHYDEVKEEYPDKNLVSWKLESRGPSNFEFIQTLQNNQPLSGSGVHTENSHYRLSRITLATREKHRQQ